MKYLSQFLIILGFTFAGEALQRIIPLPIPASVYGLLLLFGALCLGLVKLEQVNDFDIDGATHSVIILRKVSPTPQQYPRRFAKIKQQPL